MKKEYKYDDLIPFLLEAFKKEEVKKSILGREWYKRNKTTKIDSAGFCYAVSELFYKLCGGCEKWKIMRIGKEDLEIGPHYYLESRQDGFILDITADQYTKQGYSVPYEKARPGRLDSRSKRGEKLAGFIDMP